MKERINIYIVIVSLLFLFSCSSLNTNSNEIINSDSLFQSEKSSDNSDLNDGLKYRIINDFECALETVDINSENVIVPTNVEIDKGTFSNCNSLTIYCEDDFKPDGWSLAWNCSDRQVCWFGEWEYIDGTPNPNR